jgi:hypothetical protein
VLTFVAGLPKSWEGVVNAFQLLIANSSSEQSLIQDEIRWHYSQHFLAELKGEEVIESMLQSAASKKQKALLGSQLVDEKRHAALFQNQIDRIGLDSRASRYAEGYCSLVLAQNTFAEKVFSFQILTEVISASYCQWRLDNIKDVSLNEVDHAVAVDEKRHLVMGKTLLNICDQDEIQINLTEERQKELIKSMNSLCEKTVRRDMFEALSNLRGEMKDQVLSRPTSLDRYIAKSVIHEYRDIRENILAY